MDEVNPKVIELYVKLAMYNAGKDRSQQRWNVKILGIEEEIRHLEKPYTTTEMGYKPSD